MRLPLIPSTSVARSLALAAALLLAAGAMPSPALAVPVLDMHAEDFLPMAADLKKALNLNPNPVSYTHLRAHETRHDLVCRLLLEKKKKNKIQNR